MISAPEYARITVDGKILLGRSFAADGFDLKREFSIYTHIHEDHIRSFESSMGYCKMVFATHATVDLLKAMKGKYLSIKSNLRPLSYKTSVKLGDEILTLYPANHMLGSAQVLIECEGFRIAYTGDFNHVGTEPLEADVLIIESTCGLERYDYSMIDKLEAQRTLARIFGSYSNMSPRRPILIRAHRGRLQEVMHLLRNNPACTEKIFLTSGIECRIAEVYQEHGSIISPVMAINPRQSLASQVEDKDYVAFLPLGTAPSLNSTHSVIEVTNFAVSGSYKRMNSHHCRICWVDHADFNGLINYVKRSGAKLVITDANRGQGYPLAEYINRKMGDKVRAIPSGA